MTTKQDLVLRQPDAVQHLEPAPPSFSYDEMERMAASIAKSGVFGVKDKDAALALMLVAHSEGKHPASIARDFDIIQNRPAKKSEAILRDFQASGGKVEWIQRDDVAAIAVFSHPLAVKPLKIEWTLDRAKKAGLAGKDMYSKFPRQMLSARCISEGCRATAPQATGGYYTPEEMRAIDFAEVQTENAAVTQAAASVAVTQDDKAALFDSLDVKTLPELEQAFAAAWTKAKGNKDLREKLKAAYDDMKIEIARMDAERDAAEPAGE